MQNNWGKRISGEKYPEAPDNQPEAPDFVLELKGGLILRGKNVVSP